MPSVFGYLNPMKPSYKKAKEVLYKKPKKKRKNYYVPKGPYTTTCTFCLEKFITKRRSTKFCSKKCSEGLKVRERSIARKKAREERLIILRNAIPPGIFEVRREKLSAHLNAVRPRGPGSIGKREQVYEKVCPCGEPFKTAYESAKWHSAACRKRHQRMNGHA